VASLPGVKSVNNQLLVKGDQPAEHSDAWISLKVKSALLFHRNVSATGTSGMCKTASSPCKGSGLPARPKGKLTTEYARDVDNVKEVKNNMTIAKTPGHCQRKLPATRLMTPPSPRRSNHH